MGVKVKEAGVDFKSKEKMVYSTTESIICIIEKNFDEQTKKAILAKLRHSIGKPITEYPDILSLVYSQVPEEILGRGGQLSWEEDAIISALQLYSLHQQGLNDSVHLENNTKNGIGNSLSHLRREDDSKAIDRRFNEMIVSATYEGFKIHLRHLIKILKARDNSIKIDYSLLSKALYNFAAGNSDSVKLKIARDYYREKRKGENENE